MRIIAGKLGGRNFEAPKGHKTHPMSDKARGGLFSALGDIDGLAVFDGFGGSGACSFEAVSRGAAFVLVIDIDKKSVETIKKSAEKLNISSQVKAIRANASGWSDNNPDKLFDIVICDPPYDHIQLSLLQKLVKHLKGSGIYVLSWPGNLKIPEFQMLEKIKVKEYGDIQLVFYRKIS